MGGFRSKFTAHHFYRLEMDVEWLKEETDAEYERRLKEHLEHKELTRAYTQIKYMRQGFEELLKEMGDNKWGDYYWLKFICNEHMKKKDMLQRYGFNVYDHGDLVETGLSMRDVKAEKIAELRMGFRRILTLAKGQKEIEEICHEMMLRDEA